MIEPLFRRARLLSHVDQQRMRVERPTPKSELTASSMNHRMYPWIVSLNDEIKYTIRRYLHAIYLRE